MPNNHEENKLVSRSSSGSFLEFIFGTRLGDASKPSPRFKDICHQMYLAGRRSNHDGYPNWEQLEDDVDETMNSFRRLFEEDLSQFMVLDYTNWRGVRNTRIILPSGDMRFESNAWHPKPQWILYATDVSDGNVKGFAVSGIHSIRPCT
jgi:hypothetical protein